MKNKLTYFITRSSMFGIGFYTLFKNAGKDAWISVLLGTLLGIIILYVYKSIKEFFKNINLKDILCHKVLGKFYIFIFLLFYAFLMTIILVLLPMFVNSFYLLYTPKILIVIPFLLLAVYLTSKEKRVLESLSNLLCFFSIIIIIIYALFLTKYLNFSNLMPIYSEKSFNIIKASLVYAGITSIPQIITINYNTTCFKDDLKNYLLGTFFSFFIILFTILSLGDPLIKIFSFPEYAVLKQIKILDFIENIENLSTFIWYFDMFITLSALTTNIKETLPKKYNKIWLYLFLLLILYISTFVISHNYQIIITMFYLYPVILFVFFGIFATLLIYIKKSTKLKEIKKSISN